MKRLLDECIPRKFKEHLTDFECQTVPEAGLAGKKNGELLSLAESAGFQVLLTVDRGFEHEQNLGNRGIAVVLLRTRSIRLADLLPLVAELRTTIPSIQPGRLIHISQLRPNRLPSAFRSDCVLQKSKRRFAMRIASCCTKP